MLSFTLKNIPFYQNKKISILLVLFWTLFFLSFDLFVVTTNDSYTYLTMANNLDKYKLLHNGYRQFGYPFFLYLASCIGSFLDLNPLLTAVIIQKIFFYIPVGLIIFLCKPFIGVLTLCLFSNGVFVTLTNNLIPESLLIGLSLTLVLFIIILSNSTKILSLYICNFIIAVLIFFGSTVKLSFGFVATVPFAISLTILTLNHKKFKKEIFLNFLIYLMLFITMVLLSFLFAKENFKETGIEKPLVNTERTYFIGAWKKAFKHNNSSYSEPLLDIYFGSGSPYTFIRSIECKSDNDCSKITSEQHAIIFKKAIKDLQKFRNIEFNFTSFLFSLPFCGSLDDLIGFLKRSSKKLRDGDIKNAVYFLNNSKSERIGNDAFSDIFSNGYEIKYFKKFFNFGFEYSPRNIQAFLLALVFIYFFINLNNINFVFIALTGPVSFFLLTFINYVDFWRYVLPHWIFSFYGFLIFIYFDKKSKKLSS